MNRQIRIQRNVRAALRLGASGYAILPCNLKKVPQISDFKNAASSDLEQIKMWFDGKNDYVPGLLTGERNGIAVWTLTEKAMSMVSNRSRVLESIPDKLSHVGTTTQSGGAHFYFQYEVGIGCSNAGLPPGLDVRGEGGFVIGQEAVTDVGEYKVRQLHIDDDLIGLPTWPGALKVRRKRINRISQERADIGFDEFRSAVMAIPNDGSLVDSADRDWWLRIIMSIHHQTAGSEEGLRLAHEWSAQHDAYDPDHTDSVWRSLT